MSHSHHIRKAATGQATDMSEAGVDGSRPKPLGGAPSVVIHPALRTQAKTMEKRVDEAPDSGGGRQVRAEAQQSARGAEAQLSSDEADRFADSIRPSWEPPLPEQEPEPVAGTSATDSQAIARSRRNGHTWVDDTHDRIELQRELPTGGLRQQKGLLMAGGLSIGLLAVIWISMAAQPDEKPEPWDSSETVSEASEPAPSGPGAGSETDVRAPGSGSAQHSAQLAMAPLASALPDSVGSSPGNSPGSSPEAPPSEPAAAEPVQTGAPQIGSAPQVSATANASSKKRQGSAAAASSKGSRTSGRARDKSPAKVHIRVTTLPSTAELSLDGSRVPNPFEAWVPPSGRHEFRAQAKGHKKVWRLLDFGENQTVQLKLPPATGNSTARAGSRASKARQAPAAGKASAKRAQRSTTGTTRQSTRTANVRGSSSRTAARKGSRTSSARRSAGFVTESPF